jgi:hypothetical protein
MTEQTETWTEPRLPTAQEALTAFTGRTKGHMVVRAFVAYVSVALLLILGACSLPPPDPRYGPNAPHNALGQPVDPVYGTRLPGLSKCCGGP